MKRAFIPAALLSLAIAGILSASISAANRPTRAPAPAPAPGEPTLDEVRTLTDRFRDVKVALAEGYIRDPGNMCDSADMMGRPASEGAMGIHYFRPDLLGITAPPNPRVDGAGTHTDFRKPSILIYEPQVNYGSMALVAVENLVFAKAWKDSGHNAPPTFHGVPYDTMIDDPNTPIDEAHMFMPHYDRHVGSTAKTPKASSPSSTPA